MTNEDYYGAGNVATHSNWNDAASTTATNLTTNKTRLLAIDTQNNGAASAYLRLYDKATTPDPATDEPKVTFMIPAGGGKVNEKNMAMEFAEGLGYAVTAGPGTTDDTDLTNADEVVVNLEYFDRF
jgi:hypothetical protein